METKQQRASILMLPWLAHGHISPFLELAKRLAQRNFLIYFCSSPVNLNPVRETLPNKFTSSIHLVEIHLPSFPQLPPRYHTTKDLPPHLIPTLKTAFDQSKPSFDHILMTLKPNLIIYDFLQPWAQQAALAQNINSLLFFVSSAACSSFLYHIIKNPTTEFPFPALNLPDSESNKLTQFLHVSSNGLTDWERFHKCMDESTNFVLIKTSKEIEAKYIDYLSSLSNKEIVPVGPLVQDPSSKQDDEKIIDWLNKKDPSSTVFVSFGSEYFLSKEEREEVASGLELSNVNFIWVVRFHGDERISVEEALPVGFLNRVGDRGLVEGGWAPQAKILGHVALGGFVSHCGWSSTLEGITFGAPIIAMPMNLDQPWNAKMAVERGVALEVKRDQNGKFRREEIAKVIKQVVMVEEGERIRNKSRELSMKMRQKGDEEIEVAVEKLMQLALPTEPNALKVPQLN
ncbi:UDP-glucuronosyl/UDP-glucosyltransferase [Dillenia turbinata]|uniref:Glycosyltransferase n=1 Tax=Dillenia turbinata TaxID=194707 RepID=A0AAN8V841_9MAGN